MNNTTTAVNQDLGSAHTPGPWQAFVRQKSFQALFTIDCDAGLIECPPRMSHREIMANALLIAAAPELLAALQYIVQWTPDHWDGKKGRDMAKAAISKATGGAQ